MYVITYDDLIDQHERALQAEARYQRILSGAYKGDVKGGPREPTLGQDRIRRERDHARVHHVAECPAAP